MGRKRKVRRQACAVQVTASGLLRFRFRAALPDGSMRYFAEATALRDAPANRDRVQRQAELIGAEIRAGPFDYLKWFPHGNRAAEFLVATGRKPLANGHDGAPTVRQYHSAWIERKTVPLVRASAGRDHRGHFGGYILDVVGDVPLDQLSLALTNGVSLPWLSDQTGVALATLLKHYGRFVHSSEVNDLELATICGNGLLASRSAR